MVKTISRSYRSAAEALRGGYSPLSSDLQDLGVLWWVGGWPCFFQRWMWAHSPLYLISLPSLGWHHGKHDDCPADVGIALRAGRMCAQVWPPSGVCWLSLAEHTGPPRGKKTWSKACFAQGLKILPSVPGSAPKTGLGVSQVQPHSPCSCKDRLSPEVTELLWAMRFICILSGLDPTSRGLQPSLLPTVVTRWAQMLLCYCQPENTWASCSCH